MPAAALGHMRAPLVEPVEVHASLQALSVHTAHQLLAGFIVAELAAGGEDLQPLGELLQLRCQDSTQSMQYSGCLHM